MHAMLARSPDAGKWCHVASQVRADGSESGERRTRAAATTRNAAATSVSAACLHARV